MNANAFALTFTIAANTRANTNAKKQFTQHFI